MYSKRINVYVLIVIVLAVNWCYAQTTYEDPNLQAALQAQGALDLTKSQQLFEKVIANTNASAKDQSTAYRALGIIQWKHYKDYDKAKTHLLKADSIGDYRSETWLEVLRVEVESQYFLKAIAAGKRAIALSESKADQNYAKYRYCKVILDQAIHQLKTGTVHDTNLLNEATLILEGVLKTNPTNVNAADVLLGISILQEDSSKVLSSWLAYHRLPDVNSANDYLKPTAQELKNITQKWQSNTLDKSSQVTIIELLGRSRFYTYAYLLGQRFDLKDLPIITYAEYIESVRTITNEYYRLASIGKEDADQYMEALRMENEVLYKKLADENVSPFSITNFRNLIRDQFGAVFLIASSSASQKIGLVLGHIVNERLRTIEQYGKSAEFTFTELDMMVSNGYPSWFWENGGAGGYALSGGFLRIKPLFKFLAIDAWERVTDSVKRSKILESITVNLYQSDLNTDRKVLRAALSKKIELDALDQLYNQLKTKGLSGLELQLKFIEQYELFRDNATMFAHEGRHSIDRVVLGSDYRALGAKVIEFRGRLSQIAFSNAPKLELANMLVSVSSTPTGQSNQMILDVLENWIKANTAQIKAYDSKQLPLSQLYKMTDAQIISCVQQTDPFYIAYSKQTD